MRRSLLLVCLFAGSTALHAQQTTHTISPGMTRAQVIAALGKPLVQRDSDGYSYIFYKNQCTRACGMNDLVILHGDSVIDAIFRSADRRYSGKSSSPEMIPARVAARTKPSNAGTVSMPASPPAKRPMVPGPPNDVKPSIPVNRDKVKAAPGSTVHSKADTAKAPAKKP